ncbi:MAG: hypothetical protein HY842_01470 [Bacteroidetes bacterium]|nr:hypothetical protein [Bacteroidota bacterium]
MIPQRKILRVLNLIRLLREPFPKTVKQLSLLLECDERTTYRYRDLLGELTLWQNINLELFKKSELLPLADELAEKSITTCVKLKITPSLRVPWQ